MSSVTSRRRSDTNDAQQNESGYNSYNQNIAQELYDREFNSIVSALNDTPSNNKKIINDNADSPNKNSATARKREGAVPSTPILQGNGRPAKIWQLFTSKKLRGKSSLITVMLVLFGGGGAVTFFAAPATIAVQLQQVLTQDLNDQLKAFENRHAYLLRTKLKATTSGSCGVIKVACRFAYMSNRQVERFAANGSVVIERDMKGSILPNRGKVTKMTFPDPDGGDPITVSSAQELMDKLQNDMRVRSAMQRAENPWFASMTDKTFKTTLRLLGTSKASRIQGDTQEEREKSVNAVFDENGKLSADSLTPETKDGKETGRFIGPDGEVLTDEQIKNINDSATIAESATKVKPSQIISSIGKAVLITGAADSACTVYNSMRMVGALAKVEKQKLAAQMATAQLLVPANKILAGVATDGEVEFVGNKINNIGGPAQSEQIVDESKIYETGSSNSPPMKENDKMYATAWESPGVKAALYNDVIPLDTNEARFSLGGGFIGTLAKVNSFIAAAVSGGNPDPKVISEKCRYVQNPYVRGAALVAGIFVGLGTFGLAQAASISASLAITMALPYAISMAADIAAGDVFKNLYGNDFGSGAFVGTAAILSSAAMKRGMKPLSSAEAVAYTESNKETLARYAENEKYLARSEPLNVYNQYSFLGSIAMTLAPHLSQSRTTVASTVATVASIIPATFAKITNTAKAATTIERFQQCEDPGYKALGIGADIYCNVRYGLSDEELAIDPIENAQWMAQNGHVSADDESGEPIDNDQAWNYKKFMNECANRTVGYGEDQDENQGDGSSCLSTENEPLNKRFRVFTLDRSVADYMDGNDEVDSSKQIGGSGEVGVDGWAYPTTKEAVTTSGYKSADRPDHRGLDLAQPGSAMGKPIYAARDGRVVASGPASGFGNWIVILHEGVDGKTYSTVYGHMRAADLMVKVGDTVRAGQQISRIGNEGKSTGPHLHFEIWEGNAADGTCSKNNGDCSIDPTAVVENAKNSSSSSEGNSNSDPERDV